MTLDDALQPPNPSVMKKCSPSCHRHAIMDPLPLYPLTPPRPVEAVQRVVHYPQSDGGTTIHTRTVIQDIIPAAATTTTTTTSYAFEAMSTVHIKKSVKLYLATPLIYHNSCLTSCGEPVLIKAVLRPTITNNDTSRRHGPSDDPFAEIAALQVLQENNYHCYQQHHVIRLLDSMQDEQYVYLVLPYLKGQ